ncbi:hypothetical protein D0A41_02630 [Xanthomonas campestris]|nr:hypothetical protein D0A41_02630 [Xanthomonas campestris]
MVVSFAPQAYSNAAREMHSSTVEVRYTISLARKGWSDQRRRRMSPTTSARLTALRSSIFLPFPARLQGVACVTGARSP